MNSLPQYSSFKTCVDSSWKTWKSLTDSESWVNFIESIDAPIETQVTLFEKQSDKINSDELEHQKDQYIEQIKEIQKSGLAQILASSDHNSSELLLQASQKTGIKSWQISEFLDQLKEDIGLTEKNYIKYSSPSHTVQETSAAEKPQPIPDQQTSAIEQQKTDATGNTKQQAQERKNAKGKTPLILFFFGCGLALAFLCNAFIQNLNRDSDLKNASPKEISSFRRMGDSIYPMGANLPITEQICNQKGSFCIYKLKKLINSGEGYADYIYKERLNGKDVYISGSISIKAKNTTDTPNLYTFSWEDDRNKTTRGYAGAGSFSIVSDPKSKGFLTRFITNESFGIHAPIGLENTAIVYPRQFQP